MTESSEWERVGWDAERITVDNGGGWVYRFWDDDIVGIEDDHTHAVARRPSYVYVPRTVYVKINEQRASEPDVAEAVERLTGKGRAR